MNWLVNASSMLAGVGLFMLGMNYIEEALRQLAGRRFKLFLRKQTSNKLKGIAGGAIVTGVLQSSSVVNLMVLAMVGSGVLTLRNALAVILGANIGTTLDSWVVATVGFKFNIEAFALPAIGMAGMWLALSSSGNRFRPWAEFLFGFGAMFMGIGLMKDSFINLASAYDLRALQDFPAIVFVIAGFLLTTVIQSSSATVAIALSALHADSITLLSAMALVLGSELGTTVKLLVASIKGSSEKKRVALGNFLFNGITILLAYLSLDFVHRWLASVSSGDPLISLVSFQTLVNVMGVIIFYPLLNPFEKFLLKRFRTANRLFTEAAQIPAGAGDLAVDAFEKEIARLIDKVLRYQRRVITGIAVPGAGVSIDFDDIDIDSQYVLVKELHGALHQYGSSIPKSKLTPTDLRRLEQLMVSLRNASFAAKSVHDIQADIVQFRNSSSDVKYSYMEQASKEAAALIDRLASFVWMDESNTLFDDMVRLFDDIQVGYKNELIRLYGPDQSAGVSATDFSTMINFHRELFAGLKASLWSLLELRLTVEQVGWFTEKPGFIR